MTGRGVNFSSRKRKISAFFTQLEPKHNLGPRMQMKTLTKWGIKIRKKLVYSFVNRVWIDTRGQTTRKQFPEDSATASAVDLVASTRRRRRRRRTRGD